MTRLSEETVGKFFVDKDGNTWQLVSYCEYPTATVECVASSRAGLIGRRQGGAVGSPILSELELRLLVPEASEASA